MADEVLVVASKVRKYIKDESGSNTSAETYQALSDAVRKICKQAIEVAQADKRKTVMARDVEKAMENMGAGGGF